MSWNSGPLGSPLGAAITMCPESLRAFAGRKSNETRFVQRGRVRVCAYTCGGGGRRSLEA